MLRSEKVKIGISYFLSTCKCGNKKRRKRWVCLNCRKHMKYDWRNWFLSFCCSWHMKAAQMYMNAAQNKSRS